MHGRAMQTPLPKRAGPGYHDDVNPALEERAGELDTISNFGRLKQPLRVTDKLTDRQSN